MPPSRGVMRCTILLLVAISICLIGAVAPVPLVAQSPGPTYDVLGAHNSAPIISSKVYPEYRHAGSLYMTTVTISDGLTGIDAARLWLSPDYRLIPRSMVYQPGASLEQLTQKGQESFVESEKAAVSAAFSEIGIPQAVLVHRILADSPAKDALEPGDQIVSIGTSPPISSISDARRATSAASPGSPIAVVVNRLGGRKITKFVTPSFGASGPSLGVILEARPASNAVDIKLSGVGGPSAGLVFALGVVDRLSSQSLIRGRQWAGTGIINADGEVEPISGVEFKVMGARRSGATAFLSPRENCASAVAAGVEGIEIYPVDTLHDAVTLLRGAEMPPGNRC